MRNYYPLTYRQIQDDVPYTVHVHLIGGTQYSKDFPSYSAAMEYYDSPETRLPNISYVGLRPTA